MRRALASLLLVLISFGAALPFVRELQTNVPACCRRDGAHHCMAMTATTADGFKAAAGNCPYRHLAVVSTATVAILVSRQVFRLSPSASPVLSADAPLTAFRDAGNVSKRGPPPTA